MQGEEIGLFGMINFVSWHMIPAQDFETIAFFGLAGTFEILERLRPARTVNRWTELSTDVFSFSFAVLVSRLSHRLITGWAHAWLPAGMLQGWRGWERWPGSVRIALAVVLADLVIYWIHRAQHRFDPLWRTHSWHHSIQQLYWFSGFRTSFLHSLAYNIPQTVVPMLLHLSPLQMGAAYSVGLLVQFWEHTNLDVSIGPLRHILITPAYHRVHHSIAHNRANFGTTFSIWDTLFGTYFDPAKVSLNAPLGLGQPYGKPEIARMLAGV
jgi:sterol desaturase/sphingolipid hydroxylase (fatty acid hydroxylase superfamily)